MATKVMSSDGGGNTGYYDVPESAKTLMDLIEHKEMNFAAGNIFKATYRLGSKVGVGRAYDLRKIIYFAQRELDRCDSQASFGFPSGA